MSFLHQAYIEGLASSFKVNYVGRMFFQKIDRNSENHKLCCLFWCKGGIIRYFRDSNLNFVEIQQKTPEDPIIAKIFAFTCRGCTNKTISVTGFRAQEGQNDWVGVHQGEGESQIFLRERTRDLDACSMTATLVREKKKRGKHIRRILMSSSALATVQTWDSEFDPYSFILGEFLESPVQEYHSKLHCDVKIAFSLLRSVVKIQHNGK